VVFLTFGRDDSGIRVSLLDWSQDQPFVSGQLLNISNLVSYTPTPIVLPSLNNGTFIFNGFDGQAFGFCGTIRNFVLMNGYVPSENDLISYLLAPINSNF